MDVLLPTEASSFGFLARGFVLTCSMVGKFDRVIEGHKRRELSNAGQAGGAAQSLGCFPVKVS